MTDRWRKIAQWAVLGALSGTLATLAIFVPRWLNVYDALEGNISVGGVGLLLSPLSLAPGLVFGLVVGRALAREDLMPGGRYAAYIVTAGLSYFVTVQITLSFLIDMLDNVILIGVVAGAIGAALLAAATAALIPEFRRRRPMIAMILAGTALGATLFFAISSEHFFGWFLLFAPWQAGYAAAMATALEE